MKKLSKVLAPVLGLALLAGGFAIGVKNTKVEKVSADPVVEKFIPVIKENFRAEGFDNYLGNNVYGHGDFDRCIRDRFATFWNARYYNNQSNIIDTIHGADGEGKTGGIRSKEFVFNGGPYISFVLGGNVNSKVNIFDVTKEYDVYWDIHPVFKDSELSVNTQFKYVKLPEALQGDTFLIYIEDNTTSGFGGVTFGDLQVNLTYEELGKAFSAHKANLSRMESSEAVNNLMVRDYTLELYTNFGGTNVKGDINLAANEYKYSYRPVKGGEVTVKTLEGYYTEAMAAEASIENLNEGFELNNNMMFWGYDQAYSADVNNTLHFDTASSDASNHWNNNNLPFNKTGNRFFKGFYENGTGLFDGDGAKYRFLSSTFTLKGSGYISVKMAGHTARVSILNGDSADANYLQELKHVDIQTYNESGDAGNVLVSGFNTCTLVRHIINLKSFLNQKLILAITDTGSASWGAVNFDEIITYYAKDPQFKVDVAHQGDHNPFYLDKYVLEEGDTTDMAKAAQFLNSYYTTARARSNSATYCYMSSSDLSSLVTAYGNLTSEVKAIVDAAMDIDYGKNTTWGDTWFDNTPSTTKTVGESMVNIVAAVSNPSGSINMFTANGTNNTLVIIVISMIIALCAAGFFFYRRKRLVK